MDTAKFNARDGAILLGRILLVVVFLLAGIAKLGGWERTVGYMAGKGLPMVPLLLALAIIIEVVGPLLVMIGLASRWAALVLSLYLIPVTFTFHNFWALSGAEQQLQMIMFLKNLGLMGGLLAVVGLGPGRYSLDAWLKRRKEHPAEAVGRQVPEGA